MALWATSAAADVAPFEVREYRKDFDVPAQQAEETLETQADGAEGDIVGQLEDGLGSRYAGIWFDNKTGEFVVPVLGSASRAEASSELAGADLQGGYRMVPAESSWAELEAAQEQLNQELAGLMAASLVQTSIDPRTNAVAVYQAEDLEGADRASLQRLASQAGVDVELREQGIEHFDTVPAACSTIGFAACDRPMRGAVAIGEDGIITGDCSTGFKALGVGTGSRYMLTAGHCALEGEDIMHWMAEDSNTGDHYLGYTEQARWGDGADIAKINANGTYWDVSPWPNWVVEWGQDGNEFGYPVDPAHLISSEAMSFVGQQVCHSGISTGSTCGYVTAMSMSVSGTYQGENYTVNNLSKVSPVCGEQGDSGGPVYAGSTALGLTSFVDGALPRCKNYVLYTNITEDTDILGVSVAPRPPPPPPKPPTAETTPATNIQEEQATLNGTLNPNGSETTYHFDYGKTASYGSRVPAGPDAGAGAGSQTMAMYLPVALQPRTQYHYRLVASNAGGTSYGADHIFTTGVRWLIRNSNTGGNPEVGFWFGLPSERQVSGDWDGNGTTTGGSFNTTTGVWKLRNSNTTGKPDVEFQYGGAVWTEPVVGDWNGDGKTTVGVYDPSSNTWRLRNTNTPGNADLEFNFSLAAGAKVISGDWNGDGTTTVGLYNPTGTFKLRATNATSSTATEVAYGGAIWTEPVVGDWDNNKTTTIGVYDPASGYWRLRNQNTAGNAEIELQYGGVGSGPNVFKPLSGDWDGDGDETVALAKVHAETINEWLLRNTNTAGNADLAYEFSTYGTKQVTGDWNGDGIDTAGSYDPATGTWKLRNSNTSGYADVEFNFSLAAGSKPIAGDWNGDGIDTVGLYNPTGTFKLRATNATSSTATEVAYGGAIWTEPVVGDWDGNKTDTIGVFDPNAGVWRLRNQNTAGNAEIEAQFGGAYWTTPVVGDWNGDGKTTIGVFDSGPGGTNNVWRLRNTITAGNADIEVAYGGNVWAPVVGDWNGDKIDTVGVSTR